VAGKKPERRASCIEIMENRCVKGRVVYHRLALVYLHSGGRTFCTRLVTDLRVSSYRFQFARGRGAGGARLL